VLLGGKSTDTFIETGGSIEKPKSCLKSYRSLADSGEVLTKSREFLQN
jgi:hypothetical protein